MAQATLNFDEANLDPTSGLYDLYSRLFEGMRTANIVDPPSVTTNPPLDGNGDIDQAAIQSALADYTEILMKNSAYMFANAIMSTVSGGGSGGTAGVGFVSRNGDQMAGALDALYGFKAGHNNELIFDVTHNADTHKIAHVYGYLIVDEDVTIDGQLNMSDNGIYFSKHQCIYYADNALQIDSQDIKITGDVEVDGSITLGDVIINDNGIFWGTNEFYHSGNCNNADTDWAMKDAHVYGDLIVDGSQTLNGRLTALYGFDLGENNKVLLYSEYDSDNDIASLQLTSDLNLHDGYGIKFDGKYIVHVRAGNDNIVSFSAPDRVMNLGDSDDGVPTKYITLQAGLYNYGGQTAGYEIISKYGDGKFLNSLQAGAGNSGPIVLETYYKAVGDCGVTFKKLIRFNDNTGPALYSDDGKELILSMPFIRVDSNSVPVTSYHDINASFKDTDSLFHNGSLGDTVSALFETDAEFFSFAKPIESTSFSIISTKYKTRLLENALFFNDGTFIEGVVDGMSFTGNAYFNHNVGSTKFASGFAGYGWGIIRNEYTGDIGATFDELTIRKKMRVFELEVQKLSVTNGSWWVSDSCSGDIVEEVA